MVEQTGEAAAAEPAPAVSMRVLPLEFRGSGGEYFRIWIVNLLLSILTLGIYSAWAKVRRLRYFYGNTVLDNSAFEYHGQPLAILKGRLIAFGLYLVLVVATQFVPILILPVLLLAIFGVPWIIMRSRLFQMRMSSYRGLRFNFHGNYGSALAAYIGWALVAAVTLYLLAPIWLWKRVNYLLGNASYGQVRFEFKTPSGRFYEFFFITLGLGVAVAIGWVVIFGALGLGAAGLGGASATDAAPWLGIASVPVFLGLAVSMLGVAGYFQKSFINASFGGVEIGPHRVRSQLSTWPLIGIYVSNFLLIVLTLGIYYPWAKVRQYRYQIEHTSLESHGDLDQFRATAGEGMDAVGEEIGDFFDVDFGL